MIPQNELRIGNIVYHKNEHTPYPQKRLSFTDNAVHIPIYLDVFTLIQSSRVYSIPITDDWLIRLGFKEYDALFRDYQAYPVWHDSSKSFIITGFDLDTDAPYYNLVVTNDDMTNSHCIGIEIAYIHQLQNLYFALTGKELELKQNA